MFRKIVNDVKKLRSKVINYYTDYRLYEDYSARTNDSSIENLEAHIILNYHSIEKGMLHEITKPFFAKNRVLKLHGLLTNTQVVRNASRSQIRVAYQIMCRYFELHKTNNWDLTDFFTEQQYDLYKSILANDYSPKFDGVINFTKEQFYENVRFDFEKFSLSRKSVRKFTGERIPIDKIKKAVDLARTAPSVCNRQASKIYLVEDKHKIDAILDIQGGFTGYSSDVNQLLILTNDRSYYYTLGERNQFYIDGGLFLMNLLYALHFYEIANCPANWGKIVQEEKLLDNIIDIPKAEKIICLIPIGELPDRFRVTLSERRESNEIFKII